MLIIVVLEIGRNEVINDYELGVKNNIVCSGKGYMIKKTRNDIVKFETFEVHFKGGFVARTIGCYFVDHYSDDYSKLKGN